MKINKINQDKIIKAIELVCPLLKEHLIEEAYLVGSVAKGTARVDSDIDVYLINSLFRFQYEDTHDTNLFRFRPYIYTNKIVDYLERNGVRFEFVTSIKSKMTKPSFWHQYYKNEEFHFMYDYESESIKKAGEYIEIDEDLCNEIDELE